MKFTFRFVRVLSDAKSLSELPSLEGCASLEILRMDRANVSMMPNTLCRNSSDLKSLYVKLNRLFSNAFYKLEQRKSCTIFIPCFQNDFSLSFFVLLSLSLLHSSLLCSALRTIVCAFFRELKSNKLRSIPDLSHCKDLRIL